MDPQTQETQEPQSGSSVVIVEERLINRFQDCK